MLAAKAAPPMAASRLVITSKMQLNGGAVLIVLSFVLLIIHKWFLFISRRSLLFTKWLQASGSRLQANSNPKIQWAHNRPQSSACSAEFCEADPRLCGNSTGVLSLRSYRLLFLLLIPCTLYLIPATLLAAGTAQVKLAWDANTDPGIAGYKIHYGTTSGDYDSFIDVGNNTTCTISGLDEGTIYYFAATAYVSGGVESGYSEELAHTTPYADSDGDGIFDNDEINTYGTDPNKPDTDNDGISDGDELTFWGDQWNTDNDGDGLINLLDPDPDETMVSGGQQGNESNDPPDSSAGLAATLPMEIGELQIDQDWQYVELEKSFENPVVIAKSISLNGIDPAEIRIRRVDEYGFEIRLQEWEYLGGSHVEETVTYLVMEAGNYVLGDGTKVEAGIFESNRTKGFDRVDFSQRFQETPVVVTTILSTNESTAVTGRVLCIDTRDFNFRMQEQERNSKKHATETVGYIAWEPSAGTVNGLTFEINKTGDSVTNDFYTIQFSQNFINTPMFIADMQTGQGMNTANVRWQNKDAYAVEVQISEEQSKDDEIVHDTEVVGYMVFAK